MTFLKSVLASMVVILLFGWHPAMAEVIKFESFPMVNQQGQRQEFSPSEQSTLVYFYRGDW